MLYLFLILWVLMTSCSRDPTHVALADSLIKSYGKEVYNSDQLTLVASGGGFKGGVQKIEIELAGSQQLTIEEARPFFLKNVERLLTTFNADPSIRPFLHRYPLTFKDIHLGISFLDLQGNNVKPPFITYATLNNGKISYAIYDLKSDTLQVVSEE